MDEKNPPDLMEDQKALAQEVEEFHKELSKGGPNKTLLPLLCVCMCVCVCSSSKNMYI